MHDRGIIEPQAFLGLAEMAANDVGKNFKIDFHIRIEGINIVERDHPRHAIPFVGTRIFVIGAKVGLGFIIRAEEIDIGLRVFIASVRVREEPRAS